MEKTNVLLTFITILSLNYSGHDSQWASGKHPSEKISMYKNAKPYTKVAVVCPGDSGGRH